MRLKSKPETEGVVGLAVTIRRDAAVIALVYFEKYYYLNFTQSIKQGLQDVQTSCSHLPNEPDSKAKLMQRVRTNISIYSDSKNISKHYESLQKLHAIIKSCWRFFNLFNQVFIRFHTQKVLKITHHVYNESYVHLCICNFRKALAVTEIW